MRWHEMEYKVSSIIKGQVSGIEDYGIFVNLKGSYSGLIHISEISSGYVKDVKDYVSVGEEIFCKIIEVNDETKHLKLSIKDINYKTDGSEQMAIDLANGFKPLKEQLPIWTKEKLKEINNL